MGLRPIDQASRLAAAQISDLALAYAEGRYTRDEAVVEIDAALAGNGVVADRRRLVLSDALQAHVDADGWRAPIVVDVLTDAGADAELARKIHAELFPSGRSSS